MRAEIDQREEKLRQLMESVSSLDTKLSEVKAECEQKQRELVTSQTECTSLSNDLQERVSRRREISLSNSTSDYSIRMASNHGLPKCGKQNVVFHIAEYGLYPVT